MPNAAALGKDLPRLGDRGLEVVAKCGAVRVGVVLGAKEQPHGGGRSAWGRPQAWPGGSW